MSPDALAPPQQDNLPNDIINMLTELGVPPQTQQSILNKLIPYLVERDHKILEHGRSLGNGGQ